MQSHLTAARLCAELLSTLDHVIATGESVEIQRPSGAVRIVRDTSNTRLSSLKPHPGTINGDAEELADISWWVSELPFMPSWR